MQNDLFEFDSDEEQDKSMDDTIQFPSDELEKFEIDQAEAAQVEELGLETLTLQEAGQHNSLDEEYEEEGLIAEFVAYIRYGNRNILSLFAAFILLGVMATALIIMVKDLGTDRSIKSSDVIVARSSTIESDLITSTSSLPQAVSTTVAPNQPPDPAGPSQTQATTPLSSTSSLTSPTTLPSTSVASTPTLGQVPQSSEITTATSALGSSTSEITTSSTTKPSSNIQHQIAQDDSFVEISFAGDFCGSSYQYRLIEQGGAEYARDIQLQGCETSWPVNLVGLEPASSYTMVFSVIPLGSTTSISKEVAFVTEDF